jgi:2-methylfumaryl-CoA hydratase
LEQGWFVGAINAGRHAAPCFAGDTIYAWSEVLDVQPAAAGGGAGLVRLRTIAAKNMVCAAFPGPGSDSVYPPEVILDLDYWAVGPWGG